MTGTTLRILARPVLAACVLLPVFAATPAGAAALVTTDTAQVAAFQTGLTVLGFDAIPGNGGGGSGGNSGTPIQAASQITDNFISDGVRFSSTGGPIAAVSVQGLPNETDARSPFNVVGGSLPGSPLPTLGYFEPINLVFVVPNTTTPTTVARVGAWNDPTGSLIRLSVFDLGGNLLESVLANQGFFVGISNPNIASASFSFVTNQSQAGFSLDDISFGGAAVSVPAPAGLPLLLAGLAAAAGLTRRARRNV